MLRQTALQRPDFKTRLNVVYLINDVVFRAPKHVVAPSSCTMLEALQYELPCILNCVANAPGITEAGGMDKLTKVVHLWSAGGKDAPYKAGALAQFHAALVASAVPEPPSRLAPSVVSSAAVATAGPAAAPAPEIDVAAATAAAVAMAKAKAAAAGLGSAAPALKTAPYPATSTDPNTCQVGHMVTVLLGALDSGVPRYAPVVLDKLPPARPLHMEPGRLQVRVAEFRRKVEKDSMKRIAAADSEAVAAKERVERRRRGARGRSASRSRSPVRSRHARSHGSRRSSRSPQSRSPSRRHRHHTRSPSPRRKRNRI